MATNKVRTARLAKEVKQFGSGTPGIECRPKVEDVYDVLTVKMKGPPNSPYEKGFFELLVSIPDRYPFEPPLIKFITPVYHPNIDKDGRICLDALKMPKAEQDGSLTGWRVTFSLHYVLTLIQCLLAQPNADDPLVTEVATEYNVDRELFLEKARVQTEKHAVRSD